MIRLSASEILVLGFVAEKPVHGYDINKMLEQRNVRTWADIGFSSIYYVLDKLEGKQLLKSAATTGKEKKIYKLTDEGMGQLREHSAHLLGTRHPSKSNLMLGLATSWVLSEEELNQALQTRLSTLQRDFETMQNTRTQQGFPGEPAKSLFELSESLLLAEIQWIEKKLEGMES